MHHSSWFFRQVVDSAYSSVWASIKEVDMTEVVMTWCRPLIMWDEWAPSSASSSCQSSRKSRAFWSDPSLLKACLFQWPLLKRYLQCEWKWYCYPSNLWFKPKGLLCLFMVAMSWFHTVAYISYRWTRALPSPQDWLSMSEDNSFKDWMCQRS